MIDHEICKLADQLVQVGIPVDVRKSYLEYRTDQVWLSVEKRPHYCDRGRWLVKVQAYDRFALSFDEHDGFPRYYFHDESLVREIRTWLERRDLV